MEHTPLRQKPTAPSPSGEGTSTCPPLAADLDMIGRSPAIAALRARLARVAVVACPVLITGPSGAGKELAVRALHALSANRRGPLIDLNCAAIPEGLLERELFGHERGVFTGAVRQSAGLLEAVGDGTLFLDEVAELAPTLQAKLLRVLEQGTYRRIGASETLTFRGRVVAASHAPLLERVREGTFREDLYYRLAVLSARVPALRERRDDVPLLVAHFSRDWPVRFTPEAVAALQRYDWPGNVRQLRNVVQRLAALSDGPVEAEQARDEIDQEAQGAPAPAAPAPAAPAPADARDELRGFVARVLDQAVSDKLASTVDLLIEEALRRTRGNKSEAARLLGVHRKVIERRGARVATSTDR